LRNLENGRMGDAAAETRVSDWRRSKVADDL